ncbi:nitrate- and nitrite sensing domain-containing protein [Spirillospora sp. CA-294931]|uniref:sensor histidine kinase n=1 Tax=Spirillospora sp. CA-294931 TaxID=3240042 RepID=UPI003D8BBC77
MPTRLFAVIAIPTVVAGLLAGTRVWTSVDNAEDYRRTGNLATLGNHLSEFSHALENERDAMAERAAGGKAAVGSEVIKTRQGETDKAAAAVRRSIRSVDANASEQLTLAVSNITNRVEDLPALRALAERVAPGAVVDKYTESLSDVFDYHVVVAYGTPDPEIARRLLTLLSLTRAKEAASRERALIVTALWQGRFEPADLTRTQDARSQMSSQLDAFRASATGAENQVFDDTVTGPELDRAEFTRAQALALATGNPQLRVRPLDSSMAAEWNKNTSTRVDTMRKVETRLASQLDDQTRALKTDARNDAIRDAVLLFIVLLIVLITVIIVARSLVRPLRRLQGGALEIAGSRLPGLVDRLRDPEAAAGGIEVEPIDIDSTDEIGQVARAFDEVHREAVRLAADEAVLRGNINAMFVNLSRRSQSLIERQLRLIEELEQSERDEEQLANLFRLDHLATRMRRNCENLLVLGGQEQVRRWNQAVPLIDVVRASLSEVEQYERVSLRVQGDMTVAGPVVNDLVHLLAELVENATVFSAEHTKVTVSGQLLSGGGAMLQITDNGVGMSPEELEQANWRLANPPVIDFSAARRMGLFVVGRLAVRHGVRVELRAAQGGGLTAFVVLPDAVVTASQGGGVGSRGFGGREVEAPMGGVPVQTRALTAPAPEQPGPAESGAYHRHGVPDRPEPAYGGTGAYATGAGTDAYPATGPSDPYPPGSGTYPANDPYPAPGVPGDTSPHRAVPQWGDQEGWGNRENGTAPPEHRPTTGPLPVFGGESGAHPIFGGTGPQPGFGDVNRQPPQDDTTGPLPAISGSPYDTRPPEQPPRHVPPADDGQSGLPQRRPGEHLPGRTSDGPPVDLFQPNGMTGTTQDLPPQVSGAQPVVPEAQPAVRDTTGPIRAVSWDAAPGSPEETYVEPLNRAPAEPPAPPRERPAQAPPPPGRPPARSPIFDAMQSEWFQRRTEHSPTEDPVKGWDSPADAGFRAAEAVKAPVSEERTPVGLPKRVPGTNRVPGAVRSQSTPERPAARPQAAPVQQETGQEQAPGQSQSADVVRNRFASLQRGVHRGRSALRGDAGSTGDSRESPSQGDGETGGTR